MNPMIRAMMMAPKKDKKEEYHHKEKEYEHEHEQKEHTSMPADSHAKHMMKHEEELTAEKAHEITRQFRNEDDSIGPHWSMEQTKLLMQQRGYDCDPIEFYVAVNMMYSDYYKSAKEFNVNNADFYAALARAFLMDKDAKEDKLMRYISYISK